MSKRKFKVSISMSRFNPKDLEFSKLHSPEVGGPTGEAIILHSSRIGQNAESPSNLKK